MNKETKGHMPGVQLPPKTRLTLQVTMSPFLSETQLRLKWTLHHVFDCCFRAFCVCVIVPLCGRSRERGISTAPYINTHMSAAPFYGAAGWAGRWFPTGLNSIKAHQKHAYAFRQECWSLLRRKLLIASHKNSSVPDKRGNNFSFTDCWRT